jgi:hypothetical protein
MNYYALSQANPAGCPSYFLEATLLDKFYPNNTYVAHGYFPWYARQKNDRSPVFNDSMVLASQEASHPYDIIRISMDIYIASEKFVSTCKKLNVKFVDSRKISIINKAGAIISKGEYSAIIFNPTEISTIANASSELIYKHNNPCRIKKLEILETFSEHLFTIKNMQGSSNTLLCSELFRSTTHNHLERVEFIDIANLEWPRIKSA